MSIFFQLLFFKSAKNVYFNWWKNYINNNFTKKNTFLPAHIFPVIVEVLDRHITINTVSFSLLVSIVNITAITLHTCCMFHLPPSRHICLAFFLVVFIFSTFLNNKYYFVFRSWPLMLIFFRKKNDKEKTAVSVTQ